MEDREIAMSIKNGLEGIAGKEKIFVHVCTKNQGVQDWKKEIEDAIGTSRTMVFLYTVEQEEAWRWCMYEIGLFKGLQRNDENRKLICIKNSYLKELPSPIRGGPEPYNADLKEIEKFCDDILFTTKYTDHKLSRDPSSDDIIKKDTAVDRITKKFERSRLEVEYYGRRITIKLTDNQNRVVESVEDAIINETGNTMQALFGKENGVKWKELYTKLEGTKQTRWLDQLKQNIDAIQSKNAFEKDLAPISIDRNGENVSYIPLISTIIKNRIPEKEDKKGGIKWFEVTKLNIIFIKQTIGRENLLKAIPTLIPFCKIKMFLDIDAESHEKCLQVDDEGNPIEPVVEEMNQMCFDLFDTRKENFDKDKADGNPWTTSFLINRLDRLKIVEPENLKKLGEDQGRVISEVVLQGRSGSEAHVPIAFNERHKPAFRDQCFMPSLTHMQTDGDRSGKHEVTLLVAYVKDFWPPDHERNPINKHATRGGDR
jgi:hypothetical protein